MVGQQHGRTRLAHDQRGGGDVDRPRGLERADAVQAPVGQLAQRQRQRAEQPDAADAAVQPARGLGHQAGVGGLEVDDPQPILGADAAQRAAVDRRALAARRHPLLAAAEVADVAERDVRQRGAVGEGDRDAVEGQAAFGVQRAVDRVDHHAPPRVAVAVGPLAQLLGHQPERDAAAGQRLQPADDGGLGLLVDDGGVVPADAPADHRLAVVTGGQPPQHAVHVGGDALAELEPVGSQSSDSGLSRKPDHSFGKKYVDFCGITRPDAVTPCTCSTVGARSRNAAPASPESTSAVAWSSPRR